MVVPQSRESEPSTFPLPLGSRLVGCNYVRKAARDGSYWHLADIPRSRRMSAFGGIADIAAQGRDAAYDPKRTSASISCCSSEAGFSPYQSTRLSRYDAVS